MFFHCPGCHAPQFTPHLCAECENRLLEIPPLRICIHCRGPSSVGESDAPHACFPEILSLNRLADGSPLWAGIHALYPLSGVAHTFLRSQKKRPLTSSERHLRTRTRDCFSLHAPGEFDCVAPIGQSLDRRWELRGGSSHRLASIAAEILGRPRSEGLVSLSRAKQGLAQGLERYFTPLAFKWQGEGLSGKRVLLVDDFLTSGRTLTLASQVLYAEGATSVSVFVSGIRISPRARATIS